MKKYLVYVSVMLVSVILILVCNSFTNKKRVISIKAVDHAGFAVVELFTSEGCSSCPPADAAIAELLSKQIKDVYILSYHVDYWNRLGWKDEFSQQGFSARQQEYAKHLSLEGVYTPQIIVNGTAQFVGSNKSELNNAVNRAINNGYSSNIHITAKKTNNTVMVRYNITGNEPMILNTVIVLPQAVTKVKRGENGGRTLHHVNIVSNLKVAEVKGSGELTIEIPSKLTGKPLKIVAYTQAKQSFKVLGAGEADL